MATVDSNRLRTGSSSLFRNQREDFLTQVGEWVTGFGGEARDLSPFCPSTSLTVSSCHPRHPPWPATEASAISSVGTDHSTPPSLHPGTQKFTAELTALPTVSLTSTSWYLCLWVWQPKGTHDSGDPPPCLRPGQQTAAELLWMLHFLQMLWNSM